MQTLHPNPDFSDDSQAYPHRYNAMPRAPTRHWQGDVRSSFHNAPRIAGGLCYLADTSFKQTLPIPNIVKVLRSRNGSG